MRWVEGGNENNMTANMSVYFSLANGGPIG